MLGSRIFTFAEAASSNTSRGQAGNTPGSGWPGVAIRRGMRTREKWDYDSPFTKLPAPKPASTALSNSSKTQHWPDEVSKPEFIPQALVFSPL